MTAVASTRTGYVMPKWAAILFGLLSIAAGIAALFWPHITILALVVVLAIDLFMYGIYIIMAAFRTDQGKVLAVIFGVLSFLAATTLLLRPLQSIPTLLIVLSVFWVVGGLVMTIGSIIDRDEGWGWDLAMGLISVGAGIFLIARPGLSLVAIAYTAGIWMIVTGIIQLVGGFRSPALAT